MNLDLEGSADECGIVYRLFTICVSQSGIYEKSTVLALLSSMGRRHCKKLLAQYWNPGLELQSFAQSATYFARYV